MKKSKHFRKDVIIARIIAALILIVLIALIVTVVSHFTKPSVDKDSQNTQNTQDINNGNQDSEDEDTQNQNSEVQDDTSNDDTSNDDASNDDTSNDDSNTQQGSENDPDTDVVEKVYVKTTARVRLREEPNTSCRTLDGINSGVELEVLETLDGWYKVSYNGKTGYVSADYAKIVEE